MLDLALDTSFLTYLLRGFAHVLEEISVGKVSAVALSFIIEVVRGRSKSGDCYESKSDCCVLGSHGWIWVCNSKLGL